MIKVPETNPQFSMNVPGVSNAPMSREFGKEGNALENFGNAIETDSTTMLNTMLRAQGASVALKQQAQDHIDSDNYITQLKTQSPDGFMYNVPGDKSSGARTNDDGTQRTMAQEYQSWANDRFNNAQNNMNGISKAMYQPEAMRFYSGEIARTMAEGHLMLVKSNTDSINDTSRIYGDDLAQSPGAVTTDEDGKPSADISKFYRNYKNLSDQVDAQVGVSWSTQDAKEMTQKVAAGMARDQMEGAYSQIQAQKKNPNDTSHSDSIDAWLDVLNGQDPRSKDLGNRGLPTLSDVMNPTEKSAAIQRLQGMRDQATTLDISDHIQNGKDLNKTLSLGRSSDVNERAYLDQTEALWKSGRYSASEAGNEAAALEASRIVGSQQGGAFTKMSAAEQKADTESKMQDAANRLRAMAAAHGMANSEDFGITVMDRVRQEVAKSMATDEAAKEDNFTGVMQGNDSRGVRPVDQQGRAIGLIDMSNPAGALKDDPNLPTKMAAWQAQNDALYAHQFGTNKAYYSPIDKENALPQIKGVMTGQSSTAASAAIDNWKTIYGDKMPAVIDSLFKGPAGLPESYRAAFSMTDPDQRAAAIRNAQEGPTLTDKAFLIAHKPEDLKAIESAVTTQAGTQIENIAKLAHGDADQEKYAQGLKEQVRQTAKQMFMSNGGDSDQAAKNATKLILTNAPSVRPQVGPSSFFGANSQGRKFDLPLPANISENQKDIVEHNVIRATATDSLKEYGLYRPSHIDSKLDFEKVIAQTRSVYLVNGPNGKPGYTVTYQGLNDRGQPDGSEHDVERVVGGQKQQLFIPYSEVELPPSKGWLRSSQTPNYRLNLLNNPGDPSVNPVVPRGNGPGPGAQATPDQYERQGEPSWASGHNWRNPITDWKNKFEIPPNDQNYPMKGATQQDIEDYKNSSKIPSVSRGPSGSAKDIEEWTKGFDAWRAEHKTGSGSGPVDYPPGANKSGPPGIPANVKVYRGEKLS